MSPRRPRERRRGRWIFLFVLVAAGAAAWLVWPFWLLAGQFGSHPVKQPSRLYGRALELRPGGGWTPQRLESVLVARRYSPAAGDLVPGTFAAGKTFEIYRRTFLTAEGWTGGDRVRVHFSGTGSGSSVTSIARDGVEVGGVLLDPPLIASFYDDDLRERRPVISVDAEVTEDLILSVLAIEDSTFLTHPGVSLTGVLRAVWNNLRRQELSQGGSTLTQQLVKNVYLTHERTFVRKIREAILAVLLELRYDKRAIFGAYLNEIYWGRSGSVDLMGVGAASWACFGKEPAHLSLAESALLAGMIQSPSRYSPWRHPEAAKARRDMVLARLGELRWVTPERLEAARAAPVRVQQEALVARQAPYFADAMAEEARERFGVRELRDTGYTLFSTLRLRDQEKAEESLAWGVEALEKGWEKGRGKTLQAALLSVDPRDGAILAYVGGRDYGLSQFDRVSQARRQPGSAFKPVVYAAALARGTVTPATVLKDEAIQVVYDGRTWSPRNSDGKYHGRVSARTALERSLNVPTAIVAVDTGLDEVVRLARDMGIDRRMPALPSVALGATEVTPRELATVYATLANGGRRPTLHGLDAVWDKLGQPMDGTPFPPPGEVLDENVAFLVNDMLTGVLDRGTARSVRQQGLEDRLAGKTGTTNSRRDSWFAGYSPERATLVWVGYDDNSTTHLSGARAALPIWARFMARVRPGGGFPPFVPTEGIVRARIDPATGGLATRQCPTSTLELFLAEHPPAVICPQHDYGKPLEQPEIGTPPAEGNPFSRWLERMRRRPKG